jgi:hypothetical protein
MVSRSIREACLLCLCFKHVGQLPMLLSQLSSSLGRRRLVSCAAESLRNLMLMQGREHDRIAFGRFLCFLKQIVLFRQARLQGRDFGLILFDGVNECFDFLCSLLDSRQTRLLVREAQVLLLRLLLP